MLITRYRGRRKGGKEDTKERGKKKGSEEEKKEASQLTHLPGLEKCAKVRQGFRPSKEARQPSLADFSSIPDVFQIKLQISSFLHSDVMPPACPTPEP